MPNINSLDLAVGILSYNEADNIDFVVCQVAAGLERYFPHLNKVIINADLRSIRPEWVRYLGQTVFKELEFVTPLYSRNEYDGTITNHLCYPLLHSVLGRDIRQPIGGDFAFSGRLLEHWMRQDWGEYVLPYGVDIFMTSEAVLSGYSVAQVTQGSKIH